MGSSDYSGEDDKSDVLHMHPDRHGADPNEGWRRGTRGALRKSCDACTNSKTKCCGDIPCDRCKKRNLECKFSKRRRCGPKARPPDEKRSRTDFSDDGCFVTMDANGEHSPLGVAMGGIASFGGDGGGGGNGGINISITSTSSPLDGGTLSRLPLPHRSVGFNAPMTADGLSGLVGELMGPNLSNEGGGNGTGPGTSSGGCEDGDSKDFALRQATPGHPTGHYSQPPAALANGGLAFLGTSSLHHRNSNGNSTVTLASTGVVETLSPTVTSNQPPPSTAGSGIERQPSLRSARRLISSQSAPIPITLPPRDLLARSKSALLTSENLTDDAEPDRMEGWEQPEAKAGTGHTQLPSRGKLPLSLGERPKAHLRTFMRSVGSIVLLPGTEALREATNLEGDEGAETSVTTSADSAMSVSTSGRRPFDPMQVTETDGNRGTGNEGGSPVRVVSGAEDRQELDVDVFAEACRAEAWAAVAVGALFSGAGEKEAKIYVSKALKCLAQCLDATLPEVASVMVLLTLFWMHSMDNRKALRYFGFAQQVGLELESLMPEGLRHTMAFMSVMITMSLELDHETSLAVQVRDPAAWSATLRSTPEGDPFVAALEAVTMVCSRILHDNASARRGQGSAKNNSRSPPAQAQRPSKALTEMLKAAAEVLNTNAVQEGEQAPDHMLALVYGLIGYTQAARNEFDQATASAKLILEVIDRHPAVLHLPLTYTLAEASSKLVRVRGASFPTNHVEALRVARASLVFARPRQVRGDCGVSGARGGWCAFGDHILATFEKEVVPDREKVIGNGSTKAQAVESSFRRSPPVSTSRSASMSPPQGRSARSSFRTDASSPGANWLPTGDGNETARNDQESSSPRWHESTDWVDRVRNMPVIGGSSNPGVIRRSSLGGNRSPTPNEEISSLLTPGPMPAGSPNRPGRYASEPVGLALLSGVAAPGATGAPGLYSASRRPSGRPSVGARLGDRVSSGRRSTGGQDSGGAVGLSGSSNGGAGGNGAEGVAADRDSDDPPPPPNPVMTSTMSFDPNRDDPSFTLL